MTLDGVGLPSTYTVILADQRTSAIVIVYEVGGLGEPDKVVRYWNVPDSGQCIGKVLALHLKSFMMIVLEL